MNIIEQLLKTVPFSPDPITGNVTPSPKCFSHPNKTTCALSSKMTTSPHNLEAMKVRVFGLKLNSCEFVKNDFLFEKLIEEANLSQSKLAEILAAEETDDALPPDVNPLIALIDFNTEFFAGVSLKIRDARSFFQLSASGEGLGIASKNLEEGVRQGEVNFFLIRKENLHCLYAYHHQSTYMSKFAAVVKRTHDKIAEGRKAEINKSVEEKSITKAEGRRLRRQLSAMGYDIMFSKRGAEELVKDLKKVKNAKLTFENFGNKITSELRPIQRLATRSSVLLNFDIKDNAANRSAKDEIISFIKGDHLEKLRVEGTDPHDNPVAVLLEKNAEHFAEAEYDKLFGSEEVSFDSLDLALKSSGIITWLIEIAARPDVSKRIKD